MSTPDAIDIASRMDAERRADCPRCDELMGLAGLWALLFFFSNAMWIVITIMRARYWK